MLPPLPAPAILVPLTRWCRLVAECDYPAGSCVALPVVNELQSEIEFLTLEQGYYRLQVILLL